MRYVWLFIDGTFSNSWGQKAHDKFVDDKMIKLATEQGTKLIQYTCPNDKNFNFSDLMKIK